MGSKMEDENRVTNELARQGLTLNWSPTNQAWFVMEYSLRGAAVGDKREVLTVKNTLEEVEQWAKDRQ